MQSDLVTLEKINQLYEQHMKVIQTNDNSIFTVSINKLTYVRRSLLIVGNSNSEATMALVLLNSDSKNTCKVVNVCDIGIKLIGQSDDSSKKTLQLEGSIWSTYTVISLDRLSKIL